MSTAHIFLDTNIYLHAEPFDQIPWARVAGVTKAVIVLPEVTIRELDDKKHTGRTKRIRKRAQQTTTRVLEVLRSSGRIRDDLLLEEYFALPTLHMPAFSLNPAVNDDRLLASILTYREQHAERQIALVSSDAGPLLKARRLDIPTLELPSEYILESELSEIEKELQEAKTTIARLQAAQPDLALSFEDGTGWTKLSPPQAWPTESEIQKAVERQRQAHSLENRDPRAAVGNMLGIFAADANDVARYMRELPRYLERWEEWYRTELKRRQLMSQVVEISLVLVNNGYRPATDVSVILEIPLGIEVIEEFEALEADPEPTSPLQPRSPVELMGNIMLEMIPDASQYAELITRPWSPEFRLPEIMGPRIEKHDNGTSVTLFVEKAQQGAGPIPLDSAYIHVDPLRSFGIEYRIVCDELQSPQGGHLGVVVEKT